MAGNPRTATSTTVRWWLPPYTTVFVCVLVGVCVYLVFGVVNCNKLNNGKKFETTTVRGWLPPPAAVSGGGVL